MRYGYGNRAPLATLRASCLLLMAVLATQAVGGNPSQKQTDLPNAPPNGVRTLEAVLAGLDKAAAQFASLAANLEYTKVTVIVNDHWTERGNIYFERSKGKTRMMIAFREPSEKYVLFAENKVSIYRPKIAEVEEYDVSGRHELLEQFLLLGFGTSGQDLQKAYQVALGDQENLDGQETVRLELAPRSSQMAARIARIELWLAPGSWEPLQQRFFEPSGDYLLARYFDVKQNRKIPSQQFRLPLRGNVRTVKR